MKFGRRTVALWAAVAVVGAGGLAGAAVVGGRTSTPSFHRGGTFLAAGEAGRPVPYTLSDEATTTTTSAPPTSTSTAAPTRTPVGQRAARGSAPRPVPAPAPASTSTPANAPAPAGAPAPSATAIHLPATGTYGYAVDGTESASGFGSRRYPDRMTASVHGGDGVRPGELVIDERFSADHEERLILQVADGRLVATYEGGSITFGPATQTSEADYRPPMLLVPATSDPGQHKGSSEAVAGDGSVSRVEDWTVEVTGREVIDVLGTPTETWVVATHRQSRPGSAEQVTRDRTTWFDPARGIWVKWTEKFDGYRSTVGVRFAYSSQYTATLADVTPS